MSQVMNKKDILTIDNHSGFLTSSSTFLGGSAVTLAESICLLVGSSEVDTDGAGTGAAAALTALSSRGGTGAIVSVVDAADEPLPMPDRKDNVLPGGGFGLSSEGVGAFVGIAAVANSCRLVTFFSSGHESGLGVGCVSGGLGAGPSIVELLLFVTSDVGNVDFSGMVDGCVIVVDSSAGLTGGIDVSFGGGGLVSPSPLLEGRLDSIL